MNPSLPATISVLTGFFYFSICFSALGQPQIHYSIDHQHFKVDPLKNIIEGTVFRHGVIRSDDPETISLYFNELEEVGKMEVRIGAGRWKTLNNKKIKISDVEGGSFFNGITKRSFSLPADQSFTYRYKIVSKERMAVSILPLFTEVLTDTILYVLDIPVGYNLSYQLDGDLSGLKWFDIEKYPVENSGISRIRIIAVAGNHRQLLKDAPVFHFMAHPEHQTPEQHFGNWYLELLSESNDHSSVKEFVNSITKDIHGDLPGDQLLKVQALLQAVREKIRYIDYENGKGAFQPRPADEVLANRYGDCKDMSNLMRLCLGYLGIDACLGLTATPDYQFHTDFAGLQSFNHVICLAKIDSAWYALDATNSENAVPGNGGKVNQFTPIFMIGKGETLWLSEPDVDFNLKSALKKAGKDISYTEKITHFQSDLSEVPPKFRNADVLILEDRNTHKFNLEKGQLFVKESITRRYKILTTKGLNDLKAFTIKAKKLMRIDKVHVRTIKADGTEILLENAAVKRMTTVNDKNADQPYELWKFAVPGTEVGDQVELNVSFSGFFSSSGDLKYFHSKYPVLKSFLSIEVDKDLIFFSKSYNGLETARTIDNFHSRIYSWETEDINPVPEMASTIVASHFPYLMYEFYLKEANRTLNRHPENWLDLLKGLYQKELKSTVRRPHKMELFYDKISRAEDNKNYLREAIKFHKFINDNAVLTKAGHSAGSAELDNFPESLLVSDIGLIRLYKDFFERRGMSFYLGVAKSRLNGPLDMDFPSRLQIDRIFFIIPDVEGNLHFFVPKTGEHKLQSGELPPEFEGTMVLMYNPSEKKKLHRLVVPYFSDKVNRFSKKNKIYISLNDKKLHGQVFNLFTGYHAMEYGADLEQLKKENRLYNYVQKKLDACYQNASISSLTLDRPEEHAINTVKLAYHFSAECFPENVAGGWEINLAEFIDVTRIGLPDKPFSYPLYIPYLKTDESKTILIFDHPVQMTSQEIENTLISEGAAYKILVRQTDSHTIEIRSAYEVSKPEIEVDNLEGFAGIHEFIGSIKKKKIGIKLKNGFQPTD